MIKKNKVFGIGLSRTGTTSLTQALEILGYKSKHFPTSWEDAERYDALTDTPVANSYKELDAKYPSSRFILTVREMNSWLESCRRYFASYSVAHMPEVLQLRMDLYGTTEFDKEKFEKAYFRHLNDVESYFRGREENLLTLDVCGGDKWEKLCEFLNKPIPCAPFPHLNARKMI
jgi:hypothetical protein